MTVAIIAIGIIQMVWPDAFPRSKFQFMLDVIPAEIIGPYCLTVGWLRGGALFLNGRLRYSGACVRAVTAAMTSTVIAQMGASLYLTNVHAGLPPSPALAFYGSMVLMEFDAVRRALSDVRFR